jgi:cephalosporin hydroxylase
MRAYGPMVTSGSYLIVEDTCVNGHPVLPEHGPGPMEAVEEFLEETKDFVVDRSMEKHYLTFNPKGYLRKV